MLSAIIATATIHKKHFSKKKISEYEEKEMERIISDLNLPPNVRSNLANDLLPYLKAITKSGYETNRRRKVFVIGNTGK